MKNSERSYKRTKKSRENFKVLGFLLMVITKIAGIGSLRMTSLKIPLYVAINETIKMECDFDLDKESLYSVKWYKDGHEFYRYVPKEMPKVTIFPTPGVVVARRSNERSMILDRVSHNSSGRYRCEVSAEAPAFHTVSQHADMTVVVLPEQGPTIKSGKLQYQADDVIFSNCTSAPSKPHADLMWYVNEEPVNSKYLEGPFIISEENGLQIAQLRLKLQITSSHFRQGDLKLKCLATISTIYSQSDEKHVASDDGTVKLPMESRDTRLKSHMGNRASHIFAGYKFDLTLISLSSTLSMFIFIQLFFAR